MFVLKAPGLHYYSLSPAWALIGALGLEALWQESSRSAFRRPLAAAAVLAFALCAYYPVLIFVRHDVRYALTFPQNRSPLYWTWQKERPDMPFFGFPHKAGWKAIGVLFQTGLLRGSYATNEKLVRESWYIPATRAEGEMPRYVFYSVDSAGYKDIPAYRPEQIETFYSLAGQVTVEGVPRLLIYGRAEEVSGPPATYRAEDYEARHDDPALLDNLRTRPMSPLQDQDDVQE